MQITACLLCSMIWSFFVLDVFQKWMKLSGRILWCILVMLTCFCEETLFFTNHAYWGIYFLLLMLLADRKEFPRWLYAILTAFGAVLCLSKGTYVVVLPLAALAMVFFHRGMDRREKVFLCTVGAAALLQLIYSFGGQGDGASWISAAANGGISYWFRLFGRVIAEFCAYLLLPLGTYRQSIRPVIVLLMPIVFGFLAFGFVREVLLPFLRKEAVDVERKQFWLIVMYQLIVIAFFLVTVKPVPVPGKIWGRLPLGRRGINMRFFPMSVSICCC